ncbi:hypothetical protein ACOME3_006854 [Neoechinorhynchus agilis]
MRVNHTDHLKVYYIPSFSIYSGASLPTIVVTGPLIRSIIRRENISIVHGHCTFASLAHEAMIHATILGIPTVFTDHSLFGFADLSSVIVRQVITLSLRCGARRNICVSYTSKENLVLRAGLVPSEVYVIPNGVQSSEIRKNCRNQRSSDLSRCGICRSIKVFNGLRTINNHTVTIVRSAQNFIMIVPVFASRMEHRKGVDLLIPILIQMCRREPDVAFLIAGDGRRANDIREAIKSNQLERQILLLGNVEHRHMGCLLSKGNIFLSCSLTEAFCIAIVEAAAVGLLIVSTRVGGIPEVLPSPGLMMMAEPNVNDVLRVLTNAIERVRRRRRRPILDRYFTWKKYRHQNEILSKLHQRKAIDSILNGSYNWMNIAKRTVNVYNEVNGLEKLGIYRMICLAISTGFVSGPLVGLVIVIDFLFIKLFDFIDPLITH